MRLSLVVVERAKGQTMLIRPEDRAAARFLADRGRFPSGGAVPYDVAHRAIQNALNTNASRLAMLEAAIKAMPDQLARHRAYRDCL